jgi:probable rRNA maturation factor
VKQTYTIHLHLQGAQAKQAATRALRSALRAAAREALAHQRAPAPAEVSLQLAGDADLRRLNRQHLGRDYATDVLSFPAGEAGAGYLGDLAISVPRAAAQARAGGHPLKAELQLLVVHGVLHLLGHDHSAPRRKARMWAAQAEILTRLRAPITAPARVNESG